MVIETLLKDAGFAVSQPCCSRPSCFDIAARKKDNLIILKVQPDVDNLSVNDSAELNALSKSVSGTSLVISEKTREKQLEDDTVYSRYDVTAVTPKTLENVVTHGAHPLIQAGPGGYYVEVDGRAVKRRRQEMGLSAGEMAKMAGISRRTLYGYERGTVKASVTVAYKLISTLGIPIGKSVNIFEKPKASRACPLLMTARRMIAKNRLLMRIFKSARYDFAVFRKAPFDFIISIPEKARIIGGVAGKDEQDLEGRVDEILSVSKVVQAHAVLVTENEKLPNKDISCITSEKLLRVKNPQELILNLT